MYYIYIYNPHLIRDVAMVLAVILRMSATEVGIKEIKKKLLQKNSRYHLKLVLQGARRALFALERLVNVFLRLPGGRRAAAAPGRAQ